jgi:cold shock CspA family protein
MRTHGTLTKWNDDRGFGFISPPGEAPEVFVHISAFPSDGVRPRLNELVSFEIEEAPDGRRRAVRIMRPGQRSAGPPARAREQGDGRGRGFVGAVTLLAVVGLGATLYKQQAKRVAPVAPEAFYNETELAPAPPPSFTCDGRTRCSQMSSCEEATFFIRNCPDTQMDGDGDGVPCESQWCE